jgi:hypothetical protein
VSESEPDLKAKLRGEIMPASWRDLVYQFARGALFLVQTDCDLLEVALLLARDDRARVEALLASGQLRRALESDARAFQSDAAARFQFVIVQPWVLAQAL